MERYDYLIVGAGLFGSVFAHEANKAGKKVLVVEKRDRIAGNCYTREFDGIIVHEYGAHIFHTDNKEIWDYVNSFTEFSAYKHKVIASYKDRYYDLPFNMNTFRQMWGIDSIEEAKNIIHEQRGNIKDPQNLEEQCISMVGFDIYQKLAKGYSEKQWGRDCRELPVSIIQRLPLRFDFNSDYFDDEYQGIPIKGYTKMIEKMLEGIDVVLDCDFLKERDAFSYDRLVFTGPIDAYFDYCLGPLEYRSLRFETKTLDIDDFQHYPVINYTDRDIPYTRIVEHKHFLDPDVFKTVVTYEYPSEWTKGEEEFYPVPDEKNKKLYQEYKKLADKERNVIFGGRLGEYRYYDMDEVIGSALNCWKKQCK